MHFGWRGWRGMLKYLEGAEGKHPLAPPLYGFESCPVFFGKNKTFQRCYRVKSVTMKYKKLISPIFDESDPVCKRRKKSSYNKCLI